LYEAVPCLRNGHTHEDAVLLPSSDRTWATSAEVVYEIDSA
jgi:hypothetical protein